jgi:ABC-type lipoprotein release transport system permease subunit
MILGYCINCGALMYGIVGCIYGAVLGLLLAGTVEYIWECFDPTPKGVVIQAAGGNGDWDVDEEAALSPRGELPIARVFERENSKPVEVGNGS